MASSPLRRAATVLCAVACATAAAGCGSSSGPTADGSASGSATVGATPPAERGPGLLNGRVTLIDGTTLPLARLRGRVVLVVNTASRCGFTPQFTGLEALYRADQAEGLTIVGFPSNDFRQELDGNGAISKFCTLNYGVSFPMATRSHVTGAKSNPLYSAIAAQPEPAGESPSWNFTKYLLDRSGRLVARYDSSVEPDDPSLGATIDGLLDEEL